MKWEIFQRCDKRAWYHEENGSLPRFYAKNMKSVHDLPPARLSCALLPVHFSARVHLVMYLPTWLATSWILCISSYSLFSYLIRTRNLVKIPPLITYVVWCAWWIRLRSTRKYISFLRVLYILLRVLYHCAYLYPVVISSYSLMLQEAVTKMGRATRTTVHLPALTPVSRVPSFFSLIYLYICQIYTSSSLHYYVSFRVHTSCQKFPQMPFLQRIASISSIPEIQIPTRQTYRPIEIKRSRCIPRELS